MFINRQLKRFRREASPSRAFKAQLASRLMAAYDETHGRAKAPARMFRFAMAGAIALVLFCTSGVGVYAYESPAVSDGHPLYGVKTGIENVESAFARTPEARARFHMKMMRRRMAEYRHQRALGKPSPKVLERAAEELGMTFDELSSGLASPETRGELIREIEALRQEYAGTSAGEPRPPKPPLTDEQISELNALREEIMSSDASPQEKRRQFREALRAFLAEELGEIGPD